MLSAYLDGKLNPIFRPPIEDHISRCEECYFVVRETAILWGEMRKAEEGAATVVESPLNAPAVAASAGSPFSEASGLGTETVEAATPTTPGPPDSTEALANPPAVGVFPPAPTTVTPVAAREKSFVTRYLLPMAAVLFVGIGLGLWRQTHPVDPYAEAVRPLVEAVGKRRLIEPRLSGGFQFGPRISPRRSGAATSDSEMWSVAAAAGEIRQAPAVSVDRKAAMAIGDLLTGNPDSSIAILGELTREEPASASVWSDLAAAYLVKGFASDPSEAQGLRTTAALALQATDRALLLSPGMPEALFNRALAFEAMGRRDDARDAFSELARRNDAWSPAARTHLEPEPDARP